MGARDRGRGPPEKVGARRARDGAARPGYQNNSSGQIRDGGRHSQPSQRLIRAARRFLAPGRGGAR
jgi:hypothetical protein